MELLASFRLPCCLAMALILASSLVMPVKSAGLSVTGGGAIGPGTQSATQDEGDIIPSTANRGILDTVGSAVDGAVESVFNGQDMTGLEDWLAGAKEYVMSWISPTGDVVPADAFVDADGDPLVNYGFYEKVSGSVPKEYKYEGCGGFCFFGFLKSCLGGCYCAGGVYCVPTFFHG